MLATRNLGNSKKEGLGRALFRKNAVRRNLVVGYLITAHNLYFNTYLDHNFLAYIKSILT